MARTLLFLLTTALFLNVTSLGTLAADDIKQSVEKQSAEKAAVKMTAQELADWIDKRFEEEYQKAGTKPGDLVDDGTFLRRVYLDLQGRIPTVAQLRDFMAEESSFKRQDYVDRLLTSDKRPEQFSKRSADHLARVWRRMMIPAASPAVGVGPQLDPWLAKQFSANTPYDQVARKLMLVAPAQNLRGLATGAIPAEQPMTPDPDAAAGFFQQAVGQTPENLAAAYVRVFLGVRLHCAQCHDHPLADWKRNDFWGIAALLSPGEAKSDAAAKAPTITPGTETISFTAKLLWEKEPLKEIPAGKSSRELLADWMFSKDNPNFAATAVNRVWQYLCGRGLAGSVDNLDQVSPQERKILDDLAKLFVENGYDVRWLITGICKSKVYQQMVVPQGTGREQDGFVHRPLKALLPEQVFDSLEQALALPVAAADKGPRFNGERDQFVARMNESTTETPADFKGGIPQALMLMNGKLTADATSLEASRTLRAVVEAPFLSNEQKIETLYLAAVTRKPRAEEMEYLLKHVASRATDEERKQAYAEIMWGLLNGPEFVLSR
jgi:hypothetical protein